MTSYGPSWLSSWIGGGASVLSNYQKQTLESLEGSGVATLNEVIVNGKTTFNGTFKATASTFSSGFIVNGATHVIKSIFSKSVTINGTLTAVDSTFHDHISIATEQATLENSTVAKDITIRRSTASKQVLVLSKGSVIKGSVTFEVNGGKIMLLDGSKILGKITGVMKEDDAKSDQSSNANSNL